MIHEPTVRVEADDKNMNFEHQGQQFRTNDHVAEVPASLAQKLKDAGVPGVRKHSTVYSLSHISDERWNRIFRR